MNTRSVRLLFILGAAGLGTGLYFAGKSSGDAPAMEAQVRTDASAAKAPALTQQQAIDSVKRIRFGKKSVDQQASWLCHLLDGQSSNGVPFQPHKCEWRATKITPSLWRVEYTDRGVALAGNPISADKVWLLDAAVSEIQPRTIATLMITAPELVGVSTEKEINEKFIKLTGRPFAEQSSALDQEIDTLPRWRVDRGGVLSR